MNVFPAIDLKDGKVVRLFQGDYDRMTVYSDDPVETARGFRAQGASHLHIVDLDGAKDGKPVNFDTIQRIVGDTAMFTEVGGGIRDEERVLQYLKLGVSRVIIGTAAVRNFDFLHDMVKKYESKIAVGVDVKGGRVAVSG